jgi:hypothetical protein
MMTKRKPANSSPPVDPQEYERWLDGIATLSEAAAMRGCTPEALIKLHQQGGITLIRRTQRHWGIRRRDVLALPERSGSAAGKPQSSREARQIIAELVERGFLLRMNNGLLIEADQIDRVKRPRELTT